MRPTIRAALLLALALGLAAAGWAWATRWRPSSERYPVQGVDVSAANGAIEWPSVAAAGADFAYVVATRGTSERDAAFETNWNGAAAAGLRRGAIHVWAMCVGGERQANAFNTVVPADRDALPPVLALEDDPGCATPPDRARLIAELRRFFAVAEPHAGMPMLLRVPRDLERAYGITGAIDRRAWAIATLLPPGYTARAWRLWRASDLRRVDGIAGPVNWDVAAP